MVLPEEIAWHFVQVLFFGTWALIGATALWMALATRRIPRAMLQLRMFSNHVRLYRALLSLGAGTFAGLFGPSPALLGITPPLYWLVAWTTAWSIAVGHGMLTLASLARTPPATSPLLAAASER